MKATRMLFSAVLVATVALSAADARKDVEALYAKYKKAIFAKNTKTMMAMTTPDFTWITMAGVTMDRKSVETQLNAQFKMLTKITSFTMTVDKFTLKGDTAVARTTSMLKGDAMMAPKKVSKIVSASVSEDTWKKTPKGWMMQSVKSVKDVTTVDGKKISG